MSTPISRRAFVARAGGAMVVAMVDHHPLRRLLAPAVAAAATPATRIVRVVRPEDQLDVSIELVGVDLVDDQLVPAAGGFLRLTFGPQHTAEQVFTAVEPVPNAAVDQRRAGPSVVVVPVGAPTAFALVAVLELAATALTTAPGATVLDGTATALEVPAGLTLAPATGTLLDASAAPFTSADTTEVWVARLRPGVEGSALTFTAADVLGTTGLPKGSVPDAAARADIARNSIEQAALTAGRLWLSSSGAFASLRGEWDGTDVGVSRYHHDVVTGRDVHVEVTSTGYLLPFGHRAAITEIVDRAVVDDDAGVPTAIGALRRYLTILGPSVGGDRPFEADGGRAWPLPAVVATLGTTDEISLAAVADGAGLVSGLSTVHPLASADAVTVDYLATDRAGGVVSFSLPAVFVDDAVAFDPSPGGSLDRARAWAAGRADLGELHLGGQRVAYADPTTPTSDTSKATTTLRFDWTAPTVDATEDALRAAGLPALHLAMREADVVDDVVAAIGGAAGDLVTVTPHERWLRHGNGPDNADLAFLGLARAVTAVVGDEVTRGVGALELVGEVFNQLLGLGPDDIATFDPAALFGEASKVIGGIDLLALLNAVVDATVEDALPGLEVEVTDDAIVSTYAMCRRLGSVPELGFVATPKTRLCVEIDSAVSLADPTDAEVTTETRIEEFKLEFPPGFPPLVVVDFQSVRAVVSSDGTSDIVPSIRSWDFSGALSLLMSLVDSLGLGDLDLRIIGDTIDLDATLTLPDLTFGVASVRNFSMATGLELPLGEGAGHVSFGIGTKAAPLDIDIMQFGGTFWLEVGLAFGGGDAGPPSPVIGLGISAYWEMLDFSIVVVDISFALRLAVDFRYADGDVVVTGAVSLEGNISVLGLIDVSASIVASLTYRSATEQLELKGTIHYAVDTFLGKLASGTVPIGSTTIDLGDGGATTAPGRARLRAGTATAASFADRFSNAAWADYCDAFAA